LIPKEGENRKFEADFCFKLEGRIPENNLEAFFLLIAFTFV
jgi:hypothetical protein